MTLKQHTYFSQRSGYKIPDEQLALETVPTEVSNAIQSAFSRLLSSITGPYGNGKAVSRMLCEYIWTHFFHDNIVTLSSDSFHTPYQLVLRKYNSSNTQWYTKLDFIEAVINIASSLNVNREYLKDFVNELNSQFESLSYGYRVINGNVIEVTSQEEKKSIETAIEKSHKPVRDALAQAISAHCARPEGDYTGSIKYSISAIEIECCRLTKESTLGAALKKLKSKGIAIHPQLEAAFHNLYNYSNNEQTGIRHGKKVPEDTFVPTAKESLFMLVASSAFINYLHACELELTCNK